MHNMLSVVCEIVRTVKRRTYMSISYVLTIVFALVQEERSERSSEEMESGSKASRNESGSEASSLEEEEGSLGSSSEEYLESEGSTEEEE